MFEIITYHLTTFNADGTPRTNYWEHSKADNLVWYYDSKGVKTPISADIKTVSNFVRAQMALPQAQVNRCVPVLCK